MCSVIKDKAKAQLTYLSLQLSRYFRITRPEMFCKKGVLQNFAKFAGNQLFAVTF